MPARKPKRTSRKRPSRGSKPHKLTRLGLAPPLTAREVRELKARAAADMRTISNYVSFLVMEDLRRKGRRSPAAVNPDENRRPYSIHLYRTAAERKRVEAGAKGERRSVSGYVGRVIVGEFDLAAPCRRSKAEAGPLHH